MAYLSILSLIDSLEIRQKQKNLRPVFIDTETTF